MYGKRWKGRNEMAKKNQKQKSQETLQETTPEMEITAPTDIVKRYEAVDPKRVLHELEKRGISPKDTEIERTEQLFGHFVHEERKKNMELADCQPDSPDDPQGCGFLSDQTLSECPFCGKSGPVIARPKEVPKADRDIELNVKMAAAKEEHAKPEAKSDTKPKVAKVTSKDVRKKKEERGEKVEDKPAQSSDVAQKLEAIVAVDPGVVALDLPSESVGGSAADLDRLANEIDDDLRSFDQAKGFITWRMGKKFAEIRDKKLWLTLRHEDGNPVYRTFHAFVIQRFEDVTPDHAMLAIRIAGELSVEQAQAIGIAKAKAILDANNARDSEPITSAQKDELLLLAPKMSLVELKARIKRMQLPQIAAPASAEPAAVDDSDREDDDLDDDDLDDEGDDDLDDEDDDDDGPESARPSKQMVKRPQMTAVTFERKTFEVPLHCKGTQTRPAKKISDEPHGTIALPGGTKIHFVVRIGNEGQIFIDGKIDQPF